MACSKLNSTPEELTDLGSAQSQYLTEEANFVTLVGDPQSNAKIFETLCLPAVDADHLSIDLPLKEVR
jgi:hypothetical protein